MMLLKEPYGSDSMSSVYIRIERLPGAVLHYEEVTTILLQFSCPPARIPKIFSCIENSAYECLLQFGWVDSQYHLLVIALQAAGMSIEVKRVLRAGEDITEEWLEGWK